MKKDKISQALGGIDDKYLLEAAEYPAARAEAGTALKPTAKKARRLKWLVPAAACLALLLAAGSAVAIVAEAREYREAVSFFELNGLSTEGLSRSEVKEIYRDITTERFVNKKTAEVIRNSVYGVEISQDEPTPEEIAAVWDAREPTLPMTGVFYNKEYEFSEGREYNTVCRLKCYIDGEWQWTFETKDFVITDCAKAAGGTAVWGRGKIYDSTRYFPAFIALLDENGDLLWKRRLDHGSETEDVVKVLDNGDGTLAAVSRVDLKYLYLSRFDHGGKEISAHKTEIGNMGVFNAARLGDGYLVQVGSILNNDTALLYKLDGEGNIIDEISYSFEDSDGMFTVTDMVESGGKLYLSGYITPNRSNRYGTRTEIADVLDFAFNRFEELSRGKQGEELTADRIIPSEELTPVVRANYTAALLVCDPEGGRPQTFYSVKGSLGAGLSAQDGRLDWNVNSITSSLFSPTTNAFSIYGNCRVYRYSFDKDGALMGRADTGGTEWFAR